MTPLEEIEQAITHLLDARAVDPLAVAFDQALGTLYQARAIERLEATVRAIGVNLQEAVSPADYSIRTDEAANRDRAHIAQLEAALQSRVKPGDEADPPTGLPDRIQTWDDPHGHAFTMNTDTPLRCICGRKREAHSQ